MQAIQKTRPIRLLCGSLLVALLALAPLTQPAGAHALADDTIAAEAPEVVSGTVLAVQIDNSVSGTSLVHRELRLDSGGAVLLHGSATDGLQSGTRVRIAGSRRGSALETTQVELLSVSPQAAAELEVEGSLAIAHADDFAHGVSAYRYHVRDDAGGVTALAVTSLPHELRGGSRVVVSGRRAADGVSLEPQQISVLAEPSAGAQPSGLVAKSATSNSVLVILANFSNTTAPSFTPSQALSVMSSSASSVANYYAEVSYGGQLLNVTVTSSWVTMSLAATCSYTGIANAANAAAQAAGYNAANYNFVVYLFPGQSCGWSGLAYVGYPHQAFINGTGSFVTQVIAHEMGHNFGLYHAGSLSCGAASIGGSCSVAEYGDPWDTMGNQRAMHFNAMQKSALGWIGSATVVTHNSGSAVYTLSPLESSGGSTYAVRIPTSNASRTYWLEYRQPIGFDAPLASYPNAGAQVRLSSPFEWSSGADDTEIVDMTPGSGGGFGDSALLVGQQFLDSTYGVNIIVTGATSSALTVSVSKGGAGASSTSVASSVNPSSVGASVSFTASVSGTSPTGSVGFKDGSSAISGCSAVALVGSGNTRSAVCSTAALSAGTHSIVASYGGDAANAASSSSALTQTVNGIGSTTGIATSQTPTTVGNSVTFTATVSGSAPTGTVNFKDSSTSIGGCSSAALSGSGNIRTATCLTASLLAGSHSVSAVYGGDASNGGSASSALAEMVNPSASSATLASSANPSNAGATVTFTASVTGYAPTGSVNFTDGGTSISGCSAVALSGSGNTRTAQCSTSSLSAATHSIVAHYGGDANNMASASTTLSQTVVVSTSSATQTTIKSSRNPARMNRSVTFTASVSGSNPTGRVAFTSNGVVIPGCSSVALSGLTGKTAVCSTTFTTTGTFNIVAAYGGDAKNSASTSAPLAQVVQ